MTAVLRLEGVSKDFGGIHAVRDVDLTVAEGERRVILGPNGAGKTTVFNLIAGAHPVTAGRIEIFGQDETLTGAAVRARRGVARTFQTSRLLSGLSVRDNLYLAAVGVGSGTVKGHFKLRRDRRDAPARRAALAAAERTGIAHRMDAIARDLSHGEQRQVEIALALAAGPRLLLLDEPAAGLSHSERQLLSGLLRSLDREITLVMIEHDMDVALTIAERVTMMHDGRVITEGTPAEIRADARVHDLYLGRSDAG